MVCTVFGLGELPAVLRTHVTDGARTDEQRATLELDARLATELLHLGTLSAHLDRRRETLTLVPAHVTHAVSGE